MVRIRVALVILVVLALILAAIWFLQRRLIYFPDPADPPLVTGAERVTLYTSDGLELGSWLFRPPSGAPDQRMSVLVAPGNAGNRSGRAPLAAALAAEGFTVLLIDYRGYGGNPGRPSEQGLARDAEAAWQFLTADFGDRLIYFGESLGAAVVTGLATRHPPQMLVLRSPFIDLASAGREHYPFLPVDLMLRDKFPVAAPISKITAPTLVIYGTADRVVPPRQSTTVADNAAGLLRVMSVENAGHNDDYRKQLVEGLAERDWS